MVVSLSSYNLSEGGIASYQQMPVVELSTGERPFIDILQDRRYWVIHVITIPSLFVGGVIFIDSPFVYKLFGRGSFNQYFYNQCSVRHISLIKDRFSGLNEITDI